MRKGTTRVSRRRPSRTDGVQRHTDGDANRLASLASLTMARSTPRLIIPSLDGVPTSYTYTAGTEKVSALARTLVKAGIGTTALWEECRGNLTTFLSRSLHQWLVQNGDAEVLASEYGPYIGIHFTDKAGLDDGPPLDGGQILAAMKTDGRVGYMPIGAALEAMDRHLPGLGPAYYVVLDSLLSRWGGVFGHQDAIYLRERQIENIKFEIEGRRGANAAAIRCIRAENRYEMFDSDRGVPEFVKSRSFPDYKTALEILRRPKAQKFKDYIEPLMRIWGLKRFKNPLSDQGAFMGDESAHPVWLLSFRPNDAVEQALDEESQVWNEYSFLPYWAETFDPNDVAAVKSILKFLATHLRATSALTEVSRLCIELTEKKKHGR